jgi:hypothetical protein
MGQSDHIRMEGKCCHLASLFPLVQPRGKPRSERCGLPRSKRASRISPHPVMTIETSSHYVRFHDDIGIPLHPASLIRLAGATFLILGVVLIRT